MHGERIPGGVDATILLWAVVGWGDGDAVDAWLFNVRTALAAFVATTTAEATANGEGMSSKPTLGDRRGRPVTGGRESLGNINYKMDSVGPRTIPGHSHVHHGPYTAMVGRTWSKSRRRRFYIAPCSLVCVHIHCAVVTTD